MESLRSIFLSGLVLLLFAACSKDEDEALFAPASAKLTIGIEASGMATKAHGPGSANEWESQAPVNNLAVVVFSEDGMQLLGSLWQAMPNKERPSIIANIPAKATMARIIVLANVPQDMILKTTSYDDLYSRMADLSTQEQASLAMSSQVVSTNVPLVEGDNYLGYEGVPNVNGITSPLLLNSLTSGMDLMKASVHLAGSPPRDSLVVDGKQLSGRSYIHYMMENMAKDTPTKVGVKAILRETSKFGRKRSLSRKVSE